MRRSASASTNVLARGMADSDLYPHATRSHNSCLDLFQTSVTVGVVCKILSNTVVLATCSALQSKTVLTSNLDHPTVNTSQHLFHKPNTKPNVVILHWTAHRIAVRDPIPSLQILLNF